MIKKIETNRWFSIFYKRIQIHAVFYLIKWDILNIIKSKNTNFIVNLHQKFSNKIDFPEIFFNKNLFYWSINEEKFSLSIPFSKIKTNSSLYPRKKDNTYLITQIKNCPLVLQSSQSLMDLFFQNERFKLRNLKICLQPENLFLDCKNKFNMFGFLKKKHTSQHRSLKYISKILETFEACNLEKHKKLKMISNISRLITNNNNCVTKQNLKKK